MASNDRFVKHSSTITDARVQISLSQSSTDRLVDDFYIPHGVLSGKCGKCKDLLLLRYGGDAFWCSPEGIIECESTIVS